MKRKFLIFFLTISCIICVAFLFVACNDSKEHEHDWGEWEVTVPASCAELGQETRICKTDSSHKQTRDIEKLPHTPLTDWIYNGNNHWHLCDVCEEKCDITAHNLNADNICTACGVEIIKGTAGLSFMPVVVDGVNMQTYSVSIGDALNATDIVIPNYYDGLPVTHIGAYGFSNCRNLTSIKIPDSVTEIDNRAFEACRNLTSIEISDSILSIGEGAFSGCGFTSFKIPESITSISARMFTACGSLTDVILHDGVTAIGEGAFWYCKSLSSIKIPDGVTEIGEDAFGYCESLSSIKIPDGVSDIGDQTFYQCKNLKDLTIPDSVTSIGESAFYECESLTSIRIPDAVTFIGGGAFNECTNITSIKIPEGVSSIGNLTFGYCISLESITLPDSVTEIGYMAFLYCGSLESITLPDNLTYIGDRAFERCEKLQSITIPDEVTYIGDYTFYYCDEITDLTIGKSVATIGANAFEGCKKIAALSIPDSVKEIGEKAFAFCNFKTLNIGKGLTSIGEGAFFNANSYLESIVVSSDNTVYHSAGNCLIETSTKTLLIGCRNSVIPADGSVTSIADYAIDFGADLRSIVIPESIVSIGSYAITTASDITIYYEGTAQQWALIDIAVDNPYIVELNLYYYSDSYPFVDGVEYGRFWHYDETTGDPVVWDN